MTKTNDIAELDEMDLGLTALLARRRAAGGDTLSGGERQALERIKGSRTSAASARRRMRKALAKGLKKLKAGPRLMPPAPRYFGPPVRVGFDAEWVTLPDGKGGHVNEVQCITAVLACGGRETSLIFYPRSGKREDRPTVGQFFQRLISKALKEGTLVGMPDRIVAFGHFMRGDLASFGDFWAAKREFRGLGKTVVSRHGGHVLEGEEGLRLVVKGEAEGTPGGTADASSAVEQAYLRDREGRAFSVRLRFVDTIKLTPGGKGLAHVGKMIGVPKLDLHRDLGIPVAATAERPECEGMELEARYGKERMDLVFRDFSVQAEEYALNDARIALAYGQWIEKMAREQFGLKHLPSTLAGISAALVRQLAGGGDALAELVGRETRTEQRFDAQTREFRTVKRDVVSPGLAIYYQMACNAYHGGRNECFYHDPTPVGDWYDYDLPGAYTTALVALRPVDYRRIRQEADPDAFGIDDMGVAWITFRFPAGTRFPCLPVRAANGGLVFPLEGRQEDRVYACAPEIYLARRMGAEIEIIQGFKAPWRSETRIFEDFTRLVQTKRREFPKKTHAALNELWKEVGNSAYGLTAQGLKDKNGFDPHTMRSQPILQSPLTEPFLAAWATSFIRAVLGEILAGLPENGTVVTATTDGLLTDVPIERLKLDGPLCSYFADIRERLFGEREVLDPEPKHGARQLISVAVRTTFTALPAPGQELVCAKGSVKPDTASEPVAQNRFMRRLYMDQYIGMKVKHEYLISAREQFTKECDLIHAKPERALHMRYDFKRRPVRPRMQALGLRQARVAWESVPWQTLDEAEFARVRVEGWSREREKVFKTLDDYRDWEAYFEASMALRNAAAAAGIKPPFQVREDNAGGILLRLFLQAGRQGAWGVDFPPRGLTAIAKTFIEEGFPVTKEDITYAKRRAAPLLAHCVPWVAETRQLLSVILRHFPSFDYRMAFCGDNPESTDVTPGGEGAA
jgi:hypothetical protein